MPIKPFAPAIDYDLYCAALASIEKEPETALFMPPELKHWLAEMKTFLGTIALDAGIQVIDLIAAFQNRDMFTLMRALGWSIKKLTQGVHAFTNLIPKGLMKIMHHLHSTNLIQRLHEGTVKIDEILNQFPLLKKLAGPALAGFLLWIWLNESFIGSLAFDMDLSFVVAAFKGSFSLSDLFMSPQGLAMLALFAAGTFTGVGVAWLGSSTANLLLAIGYTIAKKIKPAIAKRLQPLIDKKKY